MRKRSGFIKVITSTRCSGKSYLLNNSEGKDTKKQLEIDFVANQGSKRYYIQSAYEIPNDGKWEQETRSLDKTNDSFKKIIIVERSMKPRRNDKGYVMMGVKEFLLKENSLEL